MERRMVDPTDDEIAAWADGFIRQNAYNRGVAVQIATEAAKWVRGRSVQVGWYCESPIMDGSSLRPVSISAAELSERHKVGYVWPVYRTDRSVAASGVAAPLPPCGNYECKAAQHDGVLCADGECDRSNGVRPDGAEASGEDERRAATRDEVLSDVDPVVLAAWKLQGRKVGAMLDEAQAAVIELQEVLAAIGDFAHDKSTGPAVPDALWDVRRMAYDAIKPDGVASPDGGKNG